MNKKQAKGRFEEVKGAVKEATGKAFGNEELEIKGKIQKDAGKIQADIGDAQQDIQQEKIDS